MDEDNECEGCAKNHVPKEMIQEGEPETHYEGKSRTIHSCYRCKACGTLWFVTEDEGLGGYGKYYHKGKR